MKFDHERSKALSGDFTAQPRDFKLVLVTSRTKWKLHSSLRRFRWSLWLLQCSLSSLQCFNENFTAPMADCGLKLVTFLRLFFAKVRIWTFFRGRQGNKCSCLCFSVFFGSSQPPFVLACKARSLPVLTCSFFDAAPPLECRFRADCRPLYNAVDLNGGTKCNVYMTGNGCALFCRLSVS